MLARLMFALVRFAARKGLAEAAPRAVKGEAADAGSEKKERARRTGIRGETYAYWYLRRHGYILVARNYTTPGIKGEIDLVGYDGPVLAFVEVKTRTGERKDFGTAEDAVTPEKQRNVVRMAQRFLRDRRIRDAECRFDILAIEAPAGQPPVARLHKAAFS